MFDLFCVTNRALCTKPFLSQIKEIAQSGVKGIILREKDLHPQEYQALAQKVMDLCQGHTQCILHSFVDCALSLGAPKIHLPLGVLRTLTEEQKQSFQGIGASCHSLADAKEAEALGCTYLTLGHIFPTDCKKGVPPRGLSLLETVCSHTSLPVLAIGGISPDNIRSVREAGAKGVCIMSGLMTCEDPKELVKNLMRAGEIL